MIRFISANKWFNNHHVLKNINLEIAKGEVIVICGPSGAGKSTLLRTIIKNITLAPRKVRGLSKGQAKERAEKLLGKVWAYA